MVLCRVDPSAAEGVGTENSTRSSCTSTVWDAHWDYHMRFLVYNVMDSFKLSSRAEEQLIQALTAAECTTMVSAKALVKRSDGFSFIPAEFRSRFIKSVTIADLSAGTIIYRQTIGTFFELIRCCYDADGFSRLPW